MLIRGRILRDTSTGSGLVSSDGRQYQFQLEGMWKSDISPQQNMVVEFSLDENKNIVSITAVNETELAKEQAQKTVLALKSKGLSTISDVTSTLGRPVLITTILLFISWFFLNTVSLNIYNNKVGVSFWDLLGMANSTGGLETFISLANGELSKGIYGVLAIAAISGPFIYHFWHNRIAHIANCLPLIVTGVVVFALASNAFDASSSQFGAGIAKEMLKALRPGLGLFIGLGCSLFLAFVGIRKYFKAEL